MSTQGNRDYRPAFHYLPPAGWINDPNGMVYENGTWHLFAQHNPDAPMWGNLHWRHATSTDLLHWQDLGLAIYPDEKLGMAFSGSGIIDKGNTSGLGQNGDPMILMYTHHGEYEQQSIAYSDDRVHFTSYEGNPVIPNSTERNFRDPKMFRNHALDCWSIVLAAGDHIDFYASDDFIHWRKTGEFGKVENKLGGIYECPDLFPLTAPDGKTVWVLTCSMAQISEFGGGRMQYFLGEFDGETFRETYPSAYPRLIDSGFDNYAAVTFAGYDRPMMIGWAASPSYAWFEPTGDFCCIMTYVRELSLAATDDGLQLAAKPVTPDFELKQAPALPKPENLPMPWRYVPEAAGDLPGELFHIRVEAEGCFTLTLSNDDGEALNISLSTEQALVMDRTRAGHSDFSPMFESGIFAVSTGRRKRTGPATLDLYFDRMIAEAFMDDGTLVNTTAVFPKQPYTKATLKGAGKLWIGGPKA